MGTTLPEIPNTTLPYLAFEVDAARGSIQRSGHQVGPLRILVKPKALRISQMLLQELIDNSLKIQWTTIYTNICKNKLYASQKSL